MHVYNFLNHTKSAKYSTS